jgi:hypothetical protein
MPANIQHRTDLSVRRLGMSDLNGNGKVGPIDFKINKLSKMTGMSPDEILKLHLEGKLVGTVKEYKKEHKIEDVGKLLQKQLADKRDRPIYDAIIQAVTGKSKEEARETLSADPKLARFAKKHPKIIKRIYKYANSGN